MFRSVSTVAHAVDLLHAAQVQSLHVAVCIDNTPLSCTVNTLDKHFGSMAPNMRALAFVSSAAYMKC